MVDKGYSIQRVGSDPNKVQLNLGGRFALGESEAFWDDLKRLVATPSGSYQLDLSGLESIDGGSTSLLLALRNEVIASGGDFEFTGATADTLRLLDLYRINGATILKGPPKGQGVLDQVGRETVAFFSRLRDSLDFVGQVTLASLEAIRRPRTVNWSEIPHLMERAGADGVPIVILINFLVGLIMGLQGALQLQLFNLNIYVADLVGLSVTRELGPLMTAIIVCGRSGAAFAAELGTMKVSEEVDALKTLGLDPQRFLVIPRVVALVLMVPLLTLVADFVGCLGGLFVGVTMLDLTVVAYLNQLHGALDLWDVFGGMIKAAVFAAAITLIACQRGLATRGGAAGVGTSTTSAVVTILFTLVLLDAAFTYIFTLLGI